MNEVWGEVWQTKHASALVHFSALVTHSPRRGKGRRVNVLGEVAGEDGDTEPDRGQGVGGGEAED